MSHLLYRLGRFSVRRRRWVLGAWILTLVALGAVGSSLGGEPVDDFKIPGTETQQAIDLLQERFPDQAGASARVVVATDTGTLADPAITATLDEMVQEISAQPGVVSVDPLVTPGVLGRPDDGTIGFYTVTYRDDPGDVTDAATEALLEVAEAPRAQGITVEFGGDLPFDEPEIGGTSEVIGLLVAIIVLLVAFGSVVAMGLPIGTALIGLGAGLSLITVGSAFVSVPTVAPTLATMIGLGVGIDYALFIVTRHREHLHHGMTVDDSVGRAIATAGQAVVFAGTTVVIAICGLQFVGIPLVATMGYATATVVAVAVVAAITLLPALLGFAGQSIDRLRLPGVKVATADGRHGLAERWSIRVSNQPWPFLIASVVVLLVLTIPFFSIHLGQTDAGNNPEGSTTRISYDLLSDAFGPGFNGPLTIAVALGDTDAASTLPQVAEAIGADPGVAFVSPAPQVNEAGDTAVFAVFPATSPQDVETQNLVHRIRTDIVPEVEATTGVEAVYVTGSTAAFIDISDKITARLPVFIGSVLVLSFLLLMVVFRSVLVPLKAALLNLLGIAAAYGVVVAIFQWGWGASIFGVEESIPIVSFLPMFMFAILFGLSMDYEVFLMSRIREEFLASGDNRSSVATGISTTARVITAAAIIMVSVFGSFALGSDHTVQMMGVGLATAILLDATLIRLVLVPATMALLGDRNWWLPGWLDRMLPHLDIEGEAGLPPAQYLPGHGPDASTEADRDLVTTSD